MRWWCLLVLCACDRTTPPREAAPSASVAVGLSATALASPSPSPSPTSVAPPRPIRPDRPPPADRWEEAAAAAVEGAPEGCEAQALAPWVRVACRGARALEVTEGGGDGTTYAIRTPEEVALVTRFLEGRTVRATVAWEAGSRALVLRWPRGAPRPDVVATFPAP